LLNHVVEKEVKIMDAKPSDFFVGAMDFFAIFVPGALLAFLLVPWAAREVFGPVLPALDTDAKAWIAFVVASYVLGHLLHHLGSVLDYTYDHVYVKAKRKHGEEWLLTKTKELMAKDLGAKENLPSAFYWAGSFVRLRSSTAALELDRSGGDSKFFRSLCLVALAGALVLLWKGLLIPALAALLVAAFSWVRFTKRRWDTTQRTYEYFVLLRQVPDSSGKGRE
jgi:hypothetical protein